MNSKMGSFLTTRQTKSKSGTIAYKIAFPKDVSHVIPCCLTRENNENKCSMKQIEAKLKAASERRTCHINQKRTDIKRELDKVKKGIYLKEIAIKEADKRYTETIYKIFENNSKAMEREINQATKIIPYCDNKLQTNANEVDLISKEINSSFQRLLNSNFNTLIANLKAENDRQKSKMFLAEIEKEKIIQKRISSVRNLDIICGEVKNLEISKLGNICYDIIMSKSRKTKVLTSTTKTSRIGLVEFKQKLRKAENRRTILQNLKLNNISKRLSKVNEIMAKKQQKIQTYKTVNQNRNIISHQDSNQKRNMQLQKLQCGINTHTEKIKELQSAIERQYFLRQSAVEKKLLRMQSTCEKNITELYELLERIQKKNIPEFKHQIRLLENQSQSPYPNGYKIDRRFIPVANKTVVQANRVVYNINPRSFYISNKNLYNEIHQYDITTFQQIRVLAQQNEGNLNDDALVAQNMKISNNN